MLLGLLFIRNMFHMEKATKISVRDVGCALRSVPPSGGYSEPRSAAPDWCSCASWAQSGVWNNGATSSPGRLKTTNVKKK